MTYHETIAAARNLHPHEVEIWLGIVGQQMRAQPLDAALRQADRVIDEMRARQTDPSLRVPPPLDGAEVKTATLEDAKEAAGRIEPEKGELTEEAVRDWAGEANRVHGTERGVRYVGVAEIDRAVALMREGLSAKERANSFAADLAAAVGKADRAEKERDEAKARLRPYEPCGGCPGCGSNDCPDALDHAIHRAEKAEKERDEARGSLDSLRNFLDAPDCKLPVGRVIGLVQDLRKERDEARAEVEKLRTWFEALARSSFPVSGWKSGPSKLMGYTLPEVCRILGDFDAATSHLRQRADEGAAERERWKEAHVRAVAEANNLRARAEKAEAALAEVQPVLDAVAGYWSPLVSAGVMSDHSFIMRDYADRRRKQAKGAS